MSKPDLTSWTLSRASGVDLNPTLVTQRANQFAAKTAAFASTVLLLRREGQTMRGHLVTSGGGAESVRAATDLAHTVGARVDESEVPLDLEVGNVVGWLTYESGSAVARDPQVHTDPAETARLLANALTDGSWVAVSLRRPSKKERARNQKWLSHRLSTAVPNHHSLSPDAVIVSIYAGGPDAATVRSHLEAVRSAMPGFDVITSSRVATRVSALFPWLLVGVLGLVLGVASRFVPVSSGLDEWLGPDFTVRVMSWVGGVGFAVGLVALVVAGLRFARVLPSPWSHATRMAERCRFDPPRKRRGRPTPPRAAITHGENPRPARDGEYPLHPATFLVGPQVVVGVVAPHAGVESGERETRSRKVPSALLERIGPYVGETDQGPAYLSAWDFEGQCAVTGKAGSGKSQAVRSLFGWNVLERMCPSGLRGAPGAQNTLVAFEVKGTGVRHYQAWAEALGDSIELVDMADPSSLAIDVFDIDGSVMDRAQFFINALRYTFGEQAIGDQTFETLLGVLPAALLVTPEMAGQVPGLAAEGSPVYFVHVLLGGRGDDMGRALAAELAAASVRPDAEPDLIEAVQFMSPLYGPGVTATQRRNLQSAPRNKFRQLIEMESWWSPSRPRMSWREIITTHRSVVINAGTSLSGRAVEESVRDQMSAILMYGLRHAIQRSCSGWQEMGRSVSIFADELAPLAGSSSEVIAWLKDMGREYGVRSHMATQRPSQLPERVRDAFLNFSTLISFVQENTKAADEVAKEMSADDGEVAGSDILQLRDYTAMVRTHVNKNRQDAFTVRFANFEHDRSGFAATQAYDFSTPQPGPTPPSLPQAVAGPVPETVTPPAARPIVESVEDDIEDVPDLMSW